VANIPIAFEVVENGDKAVGPSSGARRRRDVPTVFIGICTLRFGDCQGPSVMSRTRREPSDHAAIRRERSCPALSNMVLTHLSAGRFGDGNAA
jgi:hypothetical protein